MSARYNFKDATSDQTKILRTITSRYIKNSQAAQELLPISLSRFKNASFVISQTKSY